MMRWMLMMLLAAGCAGATGCVERRMTVTTEPAGALVYMNGQEIGRTPVTHDFLWYGTYDVQVRKAGYETLSTETPVIAPWWQWPPFDLFAELIPMRLTDHRKIHYTLDPTTSEQDDPQAILSRAEAMRGQLRGPRGE